MTKAALKLGLILYLLINFMILNLSQSLAQNSSIDLTYVYDLKDSQAVDGDIIISSPGSGLVRASLAYDPNIFGVDQVNPLMVYKRSDNTGTPIARNGIAQINVTDFNGQIKNGDYVTSSQIPGKGQKATSSGYVIGVALADFNTAQAQTITTNFQGPNSPSQVHLGQVPVAIRIEYAELTNSRSFSRLLDSLNIAFTQNTQNPERAIQFIKYIIAGITVLISVLISFFAFSRAIPKGIEAMGRNPLAERAILATIILNIMFTIVTIGLGLAAALVIIKL